MTQEKIGRYQVISELGRGGMATVFRALDPSFDREVAIKVLPHTFLHDPQFRARFEREAKTVAALEHSAIVPVYDFGEEDGQPYIVMRLMSGGSLADKLKDNKMPLKEAAQIITRLAPALDVAHSRGIIHRDLKPGNILFDQYNQAYLSDFGIARLTEGDATLTGSRILGTPAYMSPEQIQGDKKLDGRSDIYAMGVIFYQILMGYTPYQATTPAKVMMMHLLEPVPNLANDLPDLPPAVSAWLQKTLAKEADDRFQKAGEMGEALADAMQGKSIAQPESPRTVIASGVGTNVTRKSRPITQQPQISQPISQPISQSYTHVPQGTLPQYLTPPPQMAPQRKSRMLPIAFGGIVLLGIIAIAVIATVFSGINGKGPLAALLSQASATTAVVAIVDTDTPEPPVVETEEIIVPTDAPATPTDAPPSATPTTESAPTDTPEPTATLAPPAVTIGGADKVAFLNANNIWMINVDGSDLAQLTNDGAEKTNLGWTPDGSAITYISGKSVWMVNVETLKVDMIASFETAEYLETFSISPDGSQVAISLNRELYVVPYDLERLASARFHYNLKEMSECETLAPILTNNDTPVPVKQLRWSNDSRRIAILILANSGGRLVDLIRVHEIFNCTSDLIKQDEIPASRFTLDGYDKIPTIQNFGFDGGFLYALVSYVRNDGYGNMYIYNGDLHRADSKVKPINGNCCYRDIQFSPDGRYLIFAYQPYEAGARAQLYYIPYATIGTGAKYDPIPLPDYFFENAREKPQPILRPAP